MRILGYNIEINRRGVPSNPNTQVPNAVVSTVTDSDGGGGGIGLLFSKFQNATANNLSAFFRGTNLIADTIASMPIQVRWEDEDGYKTVIYNHYLYDCFDHNDNQITRFEMIKMLVWSVIIRGNGFIYITRDGAGKTKSLRWLHPDDVTIYYNKQKNDLYYTCPLVSKKKIEPVNMIHVKLHSDDGINGRSVISYANRSIELANATENAAADFYKSGCNLNGIIKSTGVLSPQQKKDIRESWRESMDGSGLAVLQGNLDYTPIQMSVADSQVIENRAFTVVDISRWLGISPVLLGDLTHSSYSTLEATQNEFIEHTLLPYITIIEEEMTNKIFVPSEAGFTINLDETRSLRMDKDKQVTYLKNLVDAGIMTVNEARKQLDMKAIDGGDKLVKAYTKVEDNVVGEDTGHGNK